MSIKKKLIVLVMLVAVAAVTLIAGCSIGVMSVNEFLEKNGAKNQQVTYYANGGTFSDVTDISSIPVKNIYYKEDSVITSDFGKAGDFVRWDGYIFDGWYYAELDGDGNPVFESEQDKKNNIVKSSGVKVDFSRKIPKNTHWHICAQWARDVYVKYVISCDASLGITAGGNTYHNGDEIFTQNFGSGGDTATVTGDSLPRNCNFRATNATFLQMYKDEACTQPYIGYDTVARPEGEQEFVKVYAKFIAGNYEVVRNSGDVSNMLNININSGKSYYLFAADNAQKVIDCGKTSFYPNNDIFNIKIEGNGFTLKNLKYSQTRISSGAYSVFGAFDENAGISNLTLQDVSVTMSLRTGVDAGNKPDLYLVSHSAASSAKFENFVIDGAEMTISCPNANDVIKNLSYNSTDQTFACGNLMFGGIAVTDAQFIESNAGIAVNNYDLKVTVSDQTVIERKNQEA